MGILRQFYRSCFSHCWVYRVHSLRIHSYSFLNLTDIRFIVWTFEFETMCYFSWDALSLALLDKDSLLLKRLEITEIKIN